jgi:serine/threonine-protein kinase
MNPHSSATLGRYELLDELGQGAMGVVYKARDPMLDRIVAIKTVNLTLPKDELAEYEARFYQEAKAAGGLSHRNIVVIHDIGRSERVAYMAMEFLEGQELRRMLQSHVTITLAQALEIAAQVADGLQYAHDRQIIHRDIKPANIMVLADGCIKITDFGIARMRNNEVKTMTGMILGSPKYMSPEQVSGKRADSRSDIFSLGVVLYEMLTGTSPFVADNIHGVMYQTMNFNPPAPKTLNPELPDVLNFIVAKALAKNLDDRYQNARDFARDLREVLVAGHGAAASPDTPPMPAQGPAHAQPAPVPFSRHEDKVERLLAAASVDAAGQEPDAGETSAQENTQPSLRLSEAFDNFSATMRLAALTGMEKDLDQFSESQKVARLKSLAEASRGAGPSTLSGSSTWANGDPVRATGGPVAPRGTHLRLIWTGSALLVLAAVALLILR